MCKPKTLLNTALIIGGVALAGYVLFPDLRAVIIQASPFLIVLLCPLSMIIGMMLMGKKDDQCKK